ncbi:putative bifunctional diguanylate cyclase/phosphodiesterase [Actinospica robiniae]|uniref:putative bifunctional diguanylate cyclase/phosphodiesterase n=1 Tax=Actinospica robiniae TaxID=304901 RepID=UPI00042A6508|nr:GGDEF and EAL domain-containing protein [Actinospica robiniae]
MTSTSEHGAKSGSDAVPAAPDEERDRPLTEAELDRICLHNLLSACADMIYFKDRDSRFIRASRSAAAFTGATSPEDMLGKSVRDYFTPEHVAAAFATEQEIMRSGEAVNDIEEPHLRAHTSEEETLSASKQPLRDFDGRIIGTFGISRDITARKIAERELRARTAELDRVGKELKTLIDTSPDPMTRFDRNLRCTYANPATEAITGTPQRELLGHTMIELGREPEEFVRSFDEALCHVLATGQGTEREFSVVLAGVYRYLHTRFVPEVDQSGEVRSVLAVSRDLTERRRIEEALAEQAVRDPLTGLANRTLLVSRIRQAIELGAAGRGGLAVLFLDLDRFKLINDSLGHAAGDELLAAVADRLREAVRRGDLVARFGGDEFVVLCEDVERGEAAEIAERINRCLVRPFSCAGKAIHVRSSIGIAMAEGAAADVDALLRDADAAMYQVKAAGGVTGGYRFFEPAAHEQAVQRIDLEHDLRLALEREEFRLAYQPVLDLVDGRIIGAEALIRWQHPQRGLLPPAEFIGVAEENHLIIPIGRWVVDEACRQLAVWNAELPVGAEPLTLAVNLSNRQLSHDPALVAEITKAISQHGVSPEQICLEVTETAVHEASGTARSALADLSQAGIQIALDDYGTGYSSLGHLRDIPVNALKIDRVFIEGLTRQRGDDAIVVAVITLAHALGMHVIAEGVESWQQHDRLRELGCDFVQGHLFAQPVSVAQFESLVRGGGRAAAPDARQGSESGR